jgi:hypothetical protein
MLRDRLGNPLPPEYFDDYLPPWEEVKKRYSPEFLERRERSIARHQKMIAEFRRLRDLTR